MNTEEFWKNNNNYHSRQREAGSVENNKVFFADILNRSIPLISDSGEVNNLESILELGAGEGKNIEALNYLLPTVKYKSVEINPDAASHIDQGEVYIGSVLANPFTADLVLTKGLLIHIDPMEIGKIYDVVYKAANKYILLCEYYCPRHEEVLYRGEKGRLWRNDFAGDMMDIYPDLSLVDYGFTYHRDGQDDITWFLMEKGDG